MPRSTDQSTWLADRIMHGATRRFQLKHKTDKELRHAIDLTAGSLLLVSGPTQHHWLHQVLKTKRKVGPRINLTFRKIYSDAS